MPASYSVSASTTASTTAIITHFLAAPRARIGSARAPAIMSHSKRNTSRSVFTSHERSLAQAAWSQSSARLTRESFLPFASCALCLEPAQDPVACAAAGDIFCRECALANILAQKKELQRLEKNRAQDERERAERQVQEDAEAQVRAVKEFELVQAGLEKKGARKGNTDSKTDNTDQATSSSKVDDTSRKRKFADELERVAEEDRSKARRAIEADRAAAHDARALPSFWTPSETPGTDKNGASSAARAKTPATGQPVCPAGRDGHAYSLHTLVSVQFELDSKGQRICPACNKMLSNSSRAVLAKPCGHVLCRSCVHQFVKPPTGAPFDPHAPPGTTGRVRCYVCEEDLEGDGSVKDKKSRDKKDKNDKKDKKDKKDKNRIKPGLVDIRSEGTGFSGGGVSEVKKNGIAFQC